MRSKKISALLKRSGLNLAGHATMGIAMGLVFSFLLSRFDAFGVAGLIVRSTDPKATMLVFVGSFTLAFGIGATLTGLAFMMAEEG